MRYGFWMPVFGGWLRNVDDEQMETSWEYTSRLARRAEQIGYDVTLIAELNMNDIKGVDKPSLDASARYSDSRSRIPVAHIRTLAYVRTYRSCNKASSVLRLCARPSFANT
jgi:hypothetical protein